MVRLENEGGRFVYHGVLRDVTGTGSSIRGGSVCFAFLLHVGGVLDRRIGSLCRPTFRSGRVLVARERIAACRISPASSLFRPQASGLKPRAVFSSLKPRASSLKLQASGRPRPYPRLCSYPRAPWPEVSARVVRVKLMVRRRRGVGICCSMSVSSSTSTT